VARLENLITRKSGDRRKMGKEKGGKVLSEIGELGRRRKMEKIAGNGEGDFREGENVEGENSENVGGK
jgi:hypothetical protein